MDKAGIDARDASFAHGHTYVAFGRVRCRDDVCVLTTDDQRWERALHNVVYPELLYEIGLIEQ